MGLQQRAVLARELSSPTISSSEALLSPRNDAEAPSRGSPVFEYFSSTAWARSSACAVVSIMRSGRMPSTDFVRSNDERETMARMPVDITPSTDASG